MHILITDSGVGGLSVCAYAERFFRTHGFEEPVRLTYVNASPENDFGYNSMGSMQEKLEHFDHFLHIVTDRYAPDFIYIACNTLSVLLQETQFFKNEHVPVRGIVETGVNRLFRDLNRSLEGVAMIFGTATTIEAQTYPNMLKNLGIPETRIVSQACPGLADTISEDRGGSKASAEIKKCVLAAIERLEVPATSCLTFLACTHYGYRKELFSAALNEAGMQTEILNPNEFVIDDLFGSNRGDLGDHGEPCDIDVEFVTRYRIPETALETITLFLGDISPRTVHAFQNFTHAPDLF